MARLKKLLLLANQHITRFHKELAAKDEQLRVLQHVTSAVLVVPQCTTLASWGGLSRLLAVLRTRGEPPSSIRGCVRARPKFWIRRCFQHQVLLPTDAEASTSEVR